MSLVVIGPEMMALHRTHTEVRERCPICLRFGAAPVDPEASAALSERIGRVIACNPPQSTRPEEW